MKLSSKAKHNIKQGARAEKTTVWVGKDGSTEQIITEIKRQLDQREIVKAKIQQTALKDAETKQLAARIAEQTDSHLIDVRGHTFVLYKPKSKTRASKK
jgi:putative YhbY family RNA-binding protein